MTVRVQRYVRVTVRQGADVRDGGHVSGGEMSYIGGYLGVPSRRRALILSSGS